MNHLKRYKIFLLSLCITLSVGCTTEQPLTPERAFADKKGSYPIRTKHLKQNGEPVYINRLVQQDSLYLLQHAHNPVDWWSWDDDAFDAASKQDKPIFLSIGYSTCHWCHVMERESFENIEIAEYINQHFIPIKVDREEHPDIDEIYITAVQKLSGSAGWPLTAVLTPDGSPFFGATYLRPEKLTDLLHLISDTWTNKREAVLEQAARVKKSLLVVHQNTNEANKINVEFIQAAQSAIAASLASKSSSQATFPREPEMLSLLQHTFHTLDKQPSDIVESRLLEIANGGIHDQIGGGFHRYSVDPNWNIPHFEKMLYNQAQLGQAYAQAYLLSGNQRLKHIAETTMAFMLDEMKAEGGGFYAAMDAESGGREGGYYLWDMTELATILSAEQFAIATQVYGLSDAGNLEGSNVLQFNQGNAVKFRDELPAITEALTAIRQQRIPPRTDTKIITSWNAMAISSLLTVYNATQTPRYLEAATSAANFVWRSSFHADSGLARTVPRSGNRKAGVLEDYAYLSRAMLDLYDVSGEPEWLRKSEQLVQKMLTDFLDQSSGAFRISAVQQQKNLIVNPTTARDDAIESGNSVAAQALVRLYRRTGKINYKQAAQSLIAAFSTQLFRQPQSLSGMLHAAALLNLGESGATHVAAKGKVKLTTKEVGQRLELELSIEPGWHINAARVLKKELIATELLPTASNCRSIHNVKYPEGKQVTLGFQDEPLLVYENTVKLSAEIEKADSGCQLIAAVLRLQACSDEICLEPEVLQIRTPGQFQTKVPF